MGILKRMLGLKELPPPNVVSITDANFKREVLRSKVPVLLDVWGPGCTPCKHLEPVITRLSQEYAGRVKVAEVDASTARRTAARLKVRGTPTVLYFHRGREMERVVGFRGSVYHRDYLDNELLPMVEAHSTTAPAA